MSFFDDELTRDGFLGGRLQLWQPKAGYRAATDPVFLAAFVSAKPGERVLDLGCGAGAAILCLMRRVEIRGYGIEIQGDYAELARRNATENALKLTVFDGDVRTMSAQLRAMTFDHVICNPPFYAAATHSGARDSGRDLAHRGDDLSEWIEAGLKRLGTGGCFSIIHRAERLGEILAAFAGRAGDIRILPIAPREGRAAGRVLASARKGSKADLTLLAPLVAHEGAVHAADGDDYTARARGILREMHAI